MMSKPMVEPMQATRVPDTGTPTYVIEEADDTLVRWYPLRIRFGNPKRAMQVRDELRRQDVTTYLHMEHQEVAHDDQLQHEMLPAVNNLIFVHAMKGRVKLLKRQNQICQHLQFIAKPAIDNPERSEIIYVPDRQMENFIKAETLPDPYQQRIALTWSDFLGQEHRRVRIMQGPFMGVEGEVKRIGHHRIVVALLREAQVAVGITHVSPAALEFI